ncbi:MAG: hypothetical protein HY326_00485 [Chloroflexi bacterium]|nr:hypothetical protein [Chloroflexota bacterium]
MSYLVRFVGFWYDFIVGDDWTVAVGVLLALGLTALLTRQGVDAWWPMPVAVVLLLALSLRRAIQRAGG